MNTSTCYKFIGMSQTIERGNSDLRRTHAHIYLCSLNLAHKFVLSCMFLQKCMCNSMECQFFIRQLLLDCPRSRAGFKSNTLLLQSVCQYNCEGRTRCADRPTALILWACTVVALSVHGRLTNPPLAYVQLCNIKT